MADKPDFISQLISRIEAVEAKLKEQAEKSDQELARTQARLELDYNRRVDLQQDKVILKFLEVLDGFLKAYDFVGDPRHDWKETMDQLRKLFYSQLASFGVSELTTLGTQYNPEQAEAIAVVPDGDNPPGTVVAEVLRGFLINERLLRPARVVVSAEKQEESNEVQS